MTAASPHWTEGLLPEALRRRACVLLRHDQTDNLPACPTTDAQVFEQLLDRLEILEHELEHYHTPPRPGSAYDHP